MPIRRWVLTPVLFTFLASTAVSLSPVLAQQKKEPKLDKAQQQELQAAYKLADAIAGGQSVPGEIGMSIHTDFLKAQNGLTFVPFVLSLDPAQVPSKSVTLYLRVVAKTPAAAPAAPAADDRNVKKEAIPTKEPAAAKAPEYAFQDVHFIDLKTPAPGAPCRLTRAFSVPAGDYDLYLVVKERTPAGAKGKAPAQKVGFLKYPITVPNLWGNDLTTSSIIITDEVKPLEKPPTAEQIVEQPYTFGSTIAAPAASTRLSKTGSLAVVFQIYNTGSDGNRKPDVAVEYLFYQRFTDKPEKFFNKTSPQTFNATTLPPQFDTVMGHPLPGGFSVALASFPEGEYRLEIKITDKLSGKVIVRNIMFSVAV